MAYPSSLDLSNANDALARISEAPISSFTENSTKARIIARLYPRVRGLMFAAGDWKFATARATLVATGASAPFPWAYEYVMPANVARARMVLAAVVGADNVPLEPVPFEEGVNNAGGLRVIRTDVAPATLVYTMEIIDPLLWDAGFTSSFTIQAMRQEAAISIQTQMPMGQAQSVTSARRGPSTTTMAREG
jgi:hypothetical protein